MSRLHITDDQRARLAELERSGRLTPAAVVADAKQKKSPLHGLFDWNVSHAAEKYWTIQARTIITSVRLLASSVETIIIDAPHYIRDPTASGNEQGYVTVAELQKRPAEALAAMRAEFARVEGALTRARSLAVVLGVEEHLDDLLARLVRVREIAETAA